MTSSKDDAYVYDQTFEALSEKRSTTGCRAALNIRGQHYWCDWPVDADGTHGGFGHASRAAEAVWAGTPEEP